MKVVTIFPSVILESQDWETGNRIPSTKYAKDFVFAGSKIYLYSVLKENPTRLPEKLLEEVKSVASTLLDGNGIALEDFTIVQDEFPNDTFELPTSDGERFLGYLFFDSHRDFWLRFDSIKIALFDYGGRTISQNDAPDFFNCKYRYLVPREYSSIERLPVRLDHDLALARVLEELQISDKKGYERIMTSIALFNQACLDSKHSENSAIVLVVSAFEALLEIPGHGKTENFSYAMKVFWGFDDRISAWATELYKLRSTIVHGETVSGVNLRASKHHHYPHFKIAREIFGDSVLLILDRKLMISLDSEYKRRIHRSLKSRIVPNVEKFSELLSRKKEFTFSNMKSDKELYRQFIALFDSFTLTDNSAKDKEYPVKLMIYEILEDWIGELNAALKTSSRTDEWSKQLSLRYKEILEILEKIRSNDSKYTNFEKYRLEHDLKELVYKAGPIHFPRDELYFELSEISDRVLSQFM